MFAVDILSCGGTRRKGSEAPTTVVVIRGKGHIFGACVCGFFFCVCVCECVCVCVTHDLDGDMERMDAGSRRISGAGWVGCVWLWGGLVVENTYY